MPDMNIEPNTYAYKRKLEESKGTEPDKGKVSVQKVSNTESFWNTFLKDDLKAIKDYILKDLLLPELKKMAEQSVHFMLYKSPAPTANQDRAYVSRSYETNYNRPYNNYVPAVRSDSRPMKSRVVFNDRRDAIFIIDKINDTIDQYGACSLNDLYDFYKELGADVEDPGPSGIYYGWNNFFSRDIIMAVKDGYILNLPTNYRIKGR